MDNLEQFVKFKKGSIPLILSVPHGGILECKDIPKRSKGILGIDKATVELAQELTSYLKNISVKYFSTLQTPSHIISKIRRSKIDMNRIEIEAFSENSSLAKKIYQFYHDKIRELIYYNLMMFNYSLLLDCHGFEKNKRPPGYRDVEIVIGTNNLASFFPNPVRIKDRDKNLRGEIIKKFLKLDIPIAPGHPRRREFILTGGYITQKYGASEIKGNQAMQIEFSDRIRIYDKELRKKVLIALAEVILINIIKNSMQ
jgi:N-formylglutamate amidohydrolase